MTKKIGSTDRLARERARRLKSATSGKRAELVDWRKRPFTAPRPGERIETAIFPGLCTDDAPSIAETRKGTHDRLIMMCGPRRRSGVTWHEVAGAEACERVLREVYEDRPDQMLLIDEHFLPFFAQHGEQAVLVIASCEAVV